MVNKWVISDTHFGHARILMFTKPEDQTPIRPGYRDQEGNLVPFKDIQHHDEVLVERWNARVRPEDKVYHVGDFGKMNLKFEYTYSDFNQLFDFDFEEDPTELFSIQYMLRDVIIDEIEFEYSKFG